MDKYAFDPIRTSAAYRRYQESRNNVSRNPSEIVREQDEYLDSLYWELKTGHLCKADKERLLGKIREVEKALGLPSQNYNGEM